MSTKFETGQRVPESSNEPQLTAFTGVGEVDRIEISGAGRDECAKLSMGTIESRRQSGLWIQKTNTLLEILHLTKILAELNNEAANYCILSSSLGTKTDGDLLRRKLRFSRIRAWDHAKRAQNKLIPVLRRNLIRSECTEELERMYRAFSACLEFLEQQYLITLLLQMNFNSLKDEKILINSGLSETPSNKKCNDKLLTDQRSSSEVLSVKSIGSNDLHLTDPDDLQIIQKEMDDLHELIYSMNQSIAIQAWEIDPDMETEKFTIAIENEASVAESIANTENFTEDPDNRKIRCVSIVIVTIMLIIVGGIVGILMGLLD